LHAAGHDVVPLTQLVFDLALMFCINLLLVLTLLFTYHNYSTITA